MKLEKTFGEQGTLSQDCQRVSQRSRGRWICRRKPSTSNVRRVCRVKETSRAKSIRRNEEQQDCDRVEQHSSVRDPGAQAQSKQKCTGDQQSMSPTVSTKTVKTKEAKDFSKSETEMLDVMDTLQHAISIIEKELAKSPTSCKRKSTHGTRTMPRWRSS